MKPILLLLCSLLYWSFVCRTEGVGEPWDAAAYWRLWYPLSFLLSAGAGLLLRSRGWMAGGVVTFAQLPVMAWNAGWGSLWAAGVLTLAVLAVPTIAVSALSGWFAARRPGRR
ncbi:hypothetical protein [Sphingomonas sp. S-NIH.Pt15_0812]|jgi:hypothetical protein|uniref:hypothetical protein n=1 Tax=Sphingomonas sp. S-NIH.Pt15_0812 TaxID=1920129 RepID=UPI000F7E0D5F|nr:hypothetical protein [Sphingomonas sp. S-NIH.Pt15_0812]RSU50027.1 hypothetical protein BRX43_10005 [Sphingomonas sp. S-NIH.Pt15_0812]